MATTSEVVSYDGFAEAGVVKCYQCGKCTAGCPAAEYMDLTPNRILRMVQLGDVDAAMRSRAIWYCVACQTCTARCPQLVDCAGVMDVLREMAAEQGAVSPETRRILVFQRAFLDSVRRNGRVDELELVAQFKTLAFLKDFNVPLLMKDALLAPKMMQRRKLHLRGRKVRDRAVVRRIFDRCMGRASGPVAAEAAE